MLALYLTMFIVAGMICYAGIDETLRVFAYIDLQVRYFGIQVQMKWMGWKLKRQLIKDTTDFEKFLKEYRNERDV
ncbi:hypothetical protein SSZBM1_189 [Synechococcus phage S-SZBM1]|uniref:Uncharacterized protein n=1 Tax=Synechococcus phage S-SZBM1 TaxID=2926475 RepID=A0AC61TST3_9CAUD|nr:hypothetical protein PP650_gp087 [Synechococcus phage S-SZBM1]UNH61306.1 hypothetical protein SSZBM1_189 [Synechococcus phage S-SZBM1]